MQLKRLVTLLMIGMSASSLMLAGCTSQRQFDDTAQTNSEQAQAQQPAPTLPPQERPADVPYVPTPQVVVDEMLKLAKPTSKDVIYDLGSGDGRIVITAAKQYGASGVGIDIDPQRVQESRTNAQKAGVTDRVSFRQQDLFQTDLSKASIVTLYLLPDINMRLRPKLLQELRPGTRIVSHNYDMGDWKPERVVQVQSSLGRQHTIYYWVVPETTTSSLQ